jgi:DNA-binding response OmpR family regulator
MSMNLLVIEDDDDLRAAIVSYLAHRRYNVTSCGSIAEANMALSDLRHEAKGPDAIVSHMQLRDGDGVSFYLKASSRFPKVRWILTSPERSQLAN